MPLIETVVTIELGAAIAKSICKLWLKDVPLGEDISSSLIDLFKSKTSDALAQRRGQRQFDAIGERVGESFLPLFQIEGANLDEGSRAAVAREVAAAFNTSKLSAELLLERNLEPTKLAQHILATHHINKQDFSIAEQEFYKRIIHESCGYIVDIASQLPSFTERTFAEVLKREDQILARTEQVLRELSQIRKRLDPREDAGRFEIEYRQAVARNLDVLQLIGANVALANRRHRLSVAYIMLSVEQKSPSLSKNMQNTLATAARVLEEIQIEKSRNIVSVNTALASSRRLLIRGAAGSGKTTLLQCVAVKAATRSFDTSFSGGLTDWNSKIPFYIRLRQCIHPRLPRPEDFPGLVAPAIAGMMPNRWVHDVLKEGRALVLVDGVDEVPASQRENVYIWLRDLVKSYQKVHFIVTSRPHAIEDDWLDHERFGDAELQPMGLKDIYSFIDHWHDAVREELHTNEDKEELSPLAEHLKEQVKRVRPIRNLATNPLLCAMLCALNRERRQQLPVNRLELYKACCSLLLERRDLESHIDLSDYPPLHYNQKERLLENLAYWMLKENISEVASSVADKHFSSKLANMPNVPLDTTGALVRRLFVERAGIIREPVAGQIDFTHRTFQEFFAAQAALDAGDIEVMVANAHNDQWREMIILAAGLASRPLCERLINGLIRQGDNAQKKGQQHLLHLIAVSCLETAIELGQEIRVKVERRLSQLVPPKNTIDAQALAAAGEMAVKHLARKEELSGEITAACIHALALIGSDTALDMLEAYTKDTREIVINELLKAWDSFDREIYAQRIILQLLNNETSFSFSHLPSLDGFQYFTQLTLLNLTECELVTDLTPLSSLTNLTSLDLYGSKLVSDLTPLSGLTNLISLNLSQCSQVSNLTPLSPLTNLNLLYLSRCSQVEDLTPLSHLNNLTSLNLLQCSQVRDLTPLSHLSNLTSLDLSGCSEVRDLTPLSSLTNLTYLWLSGCKLVDDLTPLETLVNLRVLDLSGCGGIRSLIPLVRLKNLERLSLPGLRVLIPPEIKDKLISTQLFPTPFD